MERRKIVDGMTLDEIFQLYREDVAPFLAKKCEELNKKYAKLLFPSHKEEFFFEPITYKRNSGFNIVLQYVDRGVNCPNRKKRLICLWYMWYRYNGKIHALRILPYGQNISIYHYTPHFIERYKERFLQDETIPKTEALLEFICHNTKVVGKNIPSKLHPENNWLVYTDGICYAEMREKILVIPALIFNFKTFISWDQLSENRKETALLLIKESATNGLEIPIPEDLLTEFEESDIN